MRTDIARRQVDWDPSTSTLTVGGRSTVITCRPGDNECLLRTYLELVAEQRSIVIGQGIHLRRDDIAVLAELLDLDDVDLEGRLRQILRISGQEAAELHRRLRRQRLVAAAVGIGLLAVPLGQSSAAAAEPSRMVFNHKSIRPAAVSPPAPDEPVEVEIGHSVTYERDPEYVPEEGVDIGDSMVVERGAP